STVSSDSCALQPEVGTKRAAETALETPAPDKKAKIETPSGQDTDDRKTVHVATPHPAKQADKAPGNSKPNLKSKYVGGAHACKSCSRTFGSASALQSHEKAKH
uniref:C2H2-type domain-containing protein n=1 Tax=Triticum urartu TaxID=4572 RepID=A0A8R7U109_TRIUA